MGSCPLQAGEAFLKMPRVLQPPLRAVPIVSAVVRAQARDRQRGLVRFPLPQKSVCTPRGSLGVTGGRKEQAASRIEHQSRPQGQGNFVQPMLGEDFELTTPNI